MADLAERGIYSYWISRLESPSRTTQFETSTKCLLSRSTRRFASHTPFRLEFFPGHGWTGETSRLRTGGAQFAEGENLFVIMFASLMSQRPPGICNSLRTETAFKGAVAALIDSLYTGMLCPCCKDRVTHTALAKPGWVQCKYKIYYYCFSGVGGSCHPRRFESLEQHYHARILALKYLACRIRKVAPTDSHSSTLSEAQEPGNHIQAQ